MWAARTLKRNPTFGPEDWENPREERAGRGSSLCVKCPKAGAHPELHIGETDWK